MGVVFEKTNTPQAAAANERLYYESHPDRAVDRIQELEDEANCLLAEANHLDDLWKKTKEQLAEAHALLFEAVDKYPVEKDPKLWTSRVRAWLEKVKC
jgi:hypothetical protein